MKIIKNCFDDDLSERSDMPIMGIPMPDNLRREFGSKREALAREFRNLYEKTSENKKLSKETSKRFDELTAKITAIDDRLAREEAAPRLDRARRIWSAFRGRLFLSESLLSLEKGAAHLKLIAG